jgi:hypothetical protein
MSTRRVTRRVFLGRVVQAGGGLAGIALISSPLVAAGAAGVSAAPMPRLVSAALEPGSGLGEAFEVVTFFDGQLWLDVSGAGPAYRAPRGARGAALLASLDDNELQQLYGRI